MKLYARILLALPLLAMATGPLSSAQPALASPAPSAGWYSLTKPVPTFRASVTAAVGGTYQVRPNDTLSSIAGRLLGSAKKWPVLWWDNRSSVPNPNSISKGQKLSYGSWDKVKPWLRKKAQRAMPQNAPVAVISASYSSSAPAGNVPTGGMSAFEACVISRESGGNPQAVNPSSGAGGLFQFLPSTWASLGFAASYPGGAQTAPVAVQEEAFVKLYDEAGTSPWAPYDGC